MRWLLLQHQLSPDCSWRRWRSGFGLQPDFSLRLSPVNLALRRNRIRNEAARFARKYGYSLKDVINLLDPQAGRRAPDAAPKAGTRKARQVKVYKNPHTGEIIETKGGNHKGLKEWKAEHGAGTVESWLTK